MLKTFFAPRYKIITTLLAVIFLLATLGITTGPSLPIIGIGSIPHRLGQLHSDVFVLFCRSHFGFSAL